MDNRYLEKLAGYKKAIDLEPFCLACGYDLRGSTPGRCPECGNVFSEAEWRKEVNRKLVSVGEADDALAFVPLSWRIALAAAALRLLATAGLVGAFGNWMLKALAVLAAIIAVGSGLSVVRVRQVPDWARSRLKNKPDYVSAWVGATLGALVIVSTIIFK